MALLRIYALTAALAVAAVSSVVWLRARRKTPEQREMLRRQRINALGRITDGTVLDLQEFDSNGLASHFVYYTYDVAGVQYECSQELTHLREYVNPQSCRIGYTASVKYDPLHPGNSIVVSESWCGLRK